MDPHNLQSFWEDTESDTSSYASPGPLLRVINWSKKSYWDTLSSYAMGRYKANVDVMTSWEISKSAKILASPLCSVTSQQHTTAGLEGQVQQASLQPSSRSSLAVCFSSGHRRGILRFTCWYMGCTALCPELLHNRPLKRRGRSPNPSPASHGSEHYPGSAL